MSTTKVWSRRPEAEEKARQPPAPAGPIAAPPSDLEAIKQDGDSFTLDSFTFEDAWVLGSLLRRRLLALRAAAVVSIALANSGQVVFQSVTGPGAVPDNEAWVRRKRNSALRWGTSTWLMHCKYGGDEAAFRAKFGLGGEAAEAYAIHGGAVPIRVRGVEGLVAVVVVSGLKQHEDHGVIVEVIKENWQPVP